MNGCNVILATHPSGTDPSAPLFVEQRVDDGQLRSAAKVVLQVHVASMVVLVPIPPESPRRCGGGASGALQK